MARQSQSVSAKEFEKMKKRNAKLEQENQKLKKQVAKNGSLDSWFSRSWRGISIVLLAAIAGGLLISGNVLFWAGHTMVDSQSYEQTITPLAKNSAVQSAVALYTTNQIFANRDITADIQNVLPPRADFLAPAISGQVKGFTQSTLNKIVASDKFQTAFININVKAHDKLLALANSPAGQDGVIDVNELYQQLTSNLQGTKLAFLADKQLPSKVGDITVLKSNKLHTLHVVSANINTFKYVMLGLVIALSALAVWISRHRRRLIIGLGLLYTVLMALSLISFRLFAHIISTKAQPEYQAGVKAAASIILHPLATQTWTVLFVFLAVALGAYLSGPYRSSKAIRGRLQMLLEGKAHGALFARENGLTLWAGRHKKPLQIASVIGVILVMLLVQLSPGLIVLYLLLILLLLGIIELVAAPRP